MRTLKDVEVAGATVIVRADFNVPMEVASNGTRVITDEGRIDAALPTIEYLRGEGAVTLLLAHLGRPAKEGKTSTTLASVAMALSRKLETEVPLLGTIEEARHRLSDAAPGAVFLLENIRHDERETSDDEAQRQELAQELMPLGDLYVSDGFGVVHREQASVTTLPSLMPSAAGLLVEQEMAAFEQILTTPVRPLVVVMGGSKVSDKLAVIGNLLPRVDSFLIGGGMAFTFLAAQGYNVGKSLLEPDLIETVTKILHEAESRGIEIVLPVDVAVANEISDSVDRLEVSVGEIPETMIGLDIGPETSAIFGARIATAGTVVWNGPMGVFELPAFAAGTRAVGEAIAQSNAYSVIGGGDSAAAIRMLRIDEDLFDHVSTGGGASLELLEGKSLPGLAVLEDQA